jgi:uncharacterized membrane protein YsdA (DUF1294 family)
MTQSSELELAMIRVAFGVAAFLLLIKIGMKRVNEFDVLGPLVLGVATCRPYLSTLGAFTSVVALVTVVGAFGINARANRRGVLFISTTLLFSELMVDYQRFVDGDLDDVDACSPILVGAILEVLLFLVLGNTLVSDDDDDYTSGSEDRAPEMRLWLVAILGIGAMRAVMLLHECGTSKTHMSYFLYALRVLLMSVACVVNGEDDAVSDACV